MPEVHDVSPSLQRPRLSLGSASGSSSSGNSDILVTRRTRTRKRVIQQRKAALVPLSPEKYDFLDFECYY